MTKTQLQLKLEQCKRDIELLEIEKVKLEEEIEKVKLEEEIEKVKLEEEIEKDKRPKFGDVVKFAYDGSRRVWLFNKTGKLRAFNVRGKFVGSLSKDYKSTGENIFDMLGLDI